QRPQVDAANIAHPLSPSFFESCKPPSPPQHYTLSLHDALPISGVSTARQDDKVRGLLLVQQPLGMNRWVVEEAFLIGTGYQVVELAVALLVHSQDGLVKLLLGVLLRHVGFNAVDSLNSVFFCGLL